jgi:hypothetical protein
MEGWSQPASEMGCPIFKVCRYNGQYGLVCLKLILHRKITTDGFLGLKGSRMYHNNHKAEGRKPKLR